MNSIVVDGILSIEPASEWLPPKPDDQYRAASKAPEDSIALAVAEIVGLAIGSALGDWGRRVFRALPPLAAVAAILPALPMLGWLTVRSGLERFEQRPGERR